MQYGFTYHSLDEVYQAAAKTPWGLPQPGKLETLGRRVKGDGFELKNALAVQPMEGCDGDEGGAPTDWTTRRYRRFARGGAGLVWVEAVAVLPEGRANPHQLMITEENLPAFKQLADDIRAAAQEEGLEPPKVIVQLTHSGRWSRPVQEKAPIRAWTSEVLDRHQALPEDWPIISDEELERLPALFARSTELCLRAGFDGVDVKACHLYLTSELLSGFDRPAPYGGSYENRTRVYLDMVDACRRVMNGRGILAARINLYDGEAGRWGVGEDLSLAMEEPMHLVRDLYAHGVRLLNLTMGTPYYNPHVNRPYATGGYEPPENPIVGVSRLLYGCRRAQQEVPGMVCLATGFSYLRQFAPQVAAGLIEEGGAQVVAFGRGGFAYPDFAKDILENGGMQPGKCCVTCGICTKIMRAGGRPGCPVRDGEWYLPEYRRVLGEK